MKRIYFVVFVLLPSLSFFSQDAFITSSNQSLIYQNPSFAGTNGFIRNQTTYRSQWPNISYPTYVTYLNSFDAYVKPLKAGMAFSAMVDDMGNGTLKTSWFSYVYAQHITFKGCGLKLIPSLQVTYFQETLDKTKLNLGDAINSRYNMYWNFTNGVWGPGIPSSSKKNIDFSSGLLALYKNFIFGATAFNINQPDIGLLGPTKLPTRICFYSSWFQKLNEDAGVQLSMIYNSQQYWNRWQLSSTFFYKKLFLNMGASDAYGRGFNEETYGRLAFTGAGVRMNKISVFYQYGVSFSKLGGSAAGSHELSLSFHLQSKKDTLIKRQPELW